MSDTETDETVPAEAASRVVTVQSMDEGCDASLCEAAREGAWRVLRLANAADADVSIYLTDDEEMAALNEAYRHRRGPTDVLSFSMTETTPDEPPEPALDTVPEILGDVVISLDTAAAQAAARGVTLADEVRELAAHGTLHLLGYDDETEEGAEQMRDLVRRALTAPENVAGNHGS